MPTPNTAIQPAKYLIFFLVTLTPFHSLKATTTPPPSIEEKIANSLDTLRFPNQQFCNTTKYLLTNKKLYTKKQLEKNYEHLQSLYNPTLNSGNPIETLLNYWRRIHLPRNSKWNSCIFAPIINTYTPLNTVTVHKYPLSNDKTLTYIQIGDLYTTLHTHLTPIGPPQYTRYTLTNKQRVTYDLNKIIHHPNPNCPMPTFEKTHQITLYEYTDTTPAHDYTILALTKTTRKQLCLHFILQTLKHLATAPFHAHCTTKTYTITLPTKREEQSLCKKIIQKQTHYNRTTTLLQQANPTYLTQTLSGIFFATKNYKLYKYYPQSHTEIFLSDTRKHKTTFQITIRPFPIHNSWHCLHISHKPTTCYLKASIPHIIHIQVSNYKGNHHMTQYTILTYTPTPPYETSTSHIEFNY